MNIKTRVRNKYFIAGCITFLVLVIKTFTDFKVPENFDNLVNTGLFVLTGLGILIDPTTPGITDQVPVQENKEQ